MKWQRENRRESAMEGSSPLERFKLLEGEGATREFKEVRRDQKRGGKRKAVRNVSISFAPKL